MAFSALSLTTALAVRTGTGQGLLGAGAALCATGFPVAAIFAHASLHGVQDQRRAVCPLYASDLLGGAVAAVVGAIVAIPAVGLAETAGWSAYLAAAAVLLL